MGTRANSRWVLFTVQERWQRDAGACVPSVAGACVVAACGDGGGEFPSSAAPRQVPSTGRGRRGETGPDLLQKQSQQFFSAFGFTPVGLLDPVSASPPYPLRPEPKLNEKHAKNSGRRWSWVSTFRLLFDDGASARVGSRPLAFAQLADKNPQAVMLHLVGPARPGGGGARWHAVASPARRTAFASQAEQVAGAWPRGPRGQASPSIHLPIVAAGTCRECQARNRVYCRVSFGVRI